MLAGIPGTRLTRTAADKRSQTSSCSPARCSHAGTRGCTRQTPAADDGTDQRAAGEIPRVNAMLSHTLARVLSHARATCAQTWHLESSPTCQHQVVSKKAPSEGVHVACQRRRISAALTGTTSEGGMLSRQARSRPQTPGQGRHRCAFQQTGHTLTADCSCILAPAPGPARAMAASRVAKAREPEGEQP